MSLVGIPWESVEISTDTSLTGASLYLSGIGATADSLSKLGAMMKDVTLVRAPEGLAETYRDWLASMSYRGTLSVVECEDDDVSGETTCETVQLLSGST